MPIDNVIPIDAEAARMLARRETRFRWFVAALSMAWLATLAPVLILTPLPPLVPFLFMAALVVFAEHRFVLFGDETSMSASIVVVVASVFVFADSAPLAGPMLIGSLGGLYLPHLRYGQFKKAIVNGTVMGLAAFLATVASLLVPVESVDSLALLATALVGVAAYWLLNNTLVAAYQAVVQGAPFRDTVFCLLTTDSEILIWAAVGALGSASATGNAPAQIAILVLVTVLRSISEATDSRRRVSNFGAPIIGPEQLLVWIAAVALLTNTADTGPAIVGSAITLTLLSAWFRPAGGSQARAVVPSLLAMVTLTSPHHRITVVLLAAGLISLLWRPWRESSLLLCGLTTAVLVQMLPSGSTPLGQLAAAGTSVAITAVTAGLGISIGVIIQLRSAHPALLLGTLMPTRGENLALCMATACGFAYANRPTVTLTVVTIGLGFALIPRFTDRRTAADASR